MADGRYSAGVHEDRRSASQDRVHGDAGLCGAGVVGAHGRRARHRGRVHSARPALRTATAPPAFRSEGPCYRAGPAGVPAGIAAQGRRRPARSGLARPRPDRRGGLRALHPVRRSCRAAARLSQRPSVPAAALPRAFSGRLRHPQRGRRHWRHGDGSDRADGRRADSGPKGDSHRAGGDHAGAHGPPRRDGGQAPAGW